jgi:hypothetical protein
MDLVLNFKTACKSGTELDCVAHKRDLNWKAGERAAVKAAINRRFRRETRRTLRAAY